MARTNCPLVTLKTLTTLLVAAKRCLCERLERSYKAVEYFSSFENTVWDFNLPPQAPTRVQGGVRPLGTAIVASFFALTFRFRLDLLLSDTGDAEAAEDGASMSLCGLFWGMLIFCSGAERLDGRSKIQIFMLSRGMRETPTLKPCMMQQVGEPRLPFTS